MFITFAADSDNKGSITIDSEYFVQNVNNNIPISILLDNVDESNTQTAVTKEYLNNYLELNNILGIHIILLGENPYWIEGGMPLHFYKISTGELLNLNWEVVDSSPTAVQIRINNSEYQTGIRDMKITYMKGIF